MLSSLVQAEGITGIYSCSSGVNNDRPVTYVFNTDLMVRNNADATPLEFLSALNNGMLLYVGRLKTDSYDFWMETTALSKEALPKWASLELKLMERRWHKPNFDVAEYVQLRALACSLGVEYDNDLYVEYDDDKNPLLFGVPDSVKPYANSCQKSLEASANAGIDDIEEFFIAKNAEKLREEASAGGYNSDRLFFDVVIVAVDLSSAQI